MAVDGTEECMWNKNDGLTLHKMRDFVIKNMTEQSLNVMIPRRNIKVPHIKSKKVQQLQARPRDPNASPHLLMIAPHNDVRYRTLHASQSLPNGYARKKQYQNHSQPCTSSHYLSTPSLHSSVRKMAADCTTQKSVEQSKAWYNSGPNILPQQIPGSDYFQQISTIAAMAWSDCSQATEKLRRIYEQTSFLGRDSLAVLNPYTTQYTSNQFVPNDVIEHVRRNHEMAPQRQKVKSKVKTERYNNWDASSMHCACAVCEMSKRTNPTPVASHATTNQHYKQRPMKTVDHMTRGAVNQIMTRSKRARSPDNFYTQNHPPKKVVKQEPYLLMNSQMQRHQASQFIPPMEDNLSSYLTAGCLPLTTSENLNYFNPNLLLPPSIQLPTASNQMTSSNEFSMTSSNPHDLVITPSFENSQLFNSHASNPFGGAIFNGFSNFLPPTILNALE